jgi:thioredoxin reductase (NADPH)
MVKDTQSGEVREEVAEGLFVAIGHTPATGFLQGAVELDEKGYVMTGLTYPINSKFEIRNSNPNESLWLAGYPTMTSVEGVFAGGDNVDFRYRQAVTAAGMGVQAALDAERWLEMGL